MITRKKLIKKYLDFFKSKNHKEIPNAPLVPENDPTTLFISAGMQPLVPNLLGQSHPLGKRLCNMQKCIRTVDIEEVGDNCHHTFLEMLGNWSLGDYWKQEAIEMTFEFLTKILKISKDKISVTCFKGDKNAPKDIEAAKIWKSLGIPKQRIKFLGKDNWWGPAGQTGPCGPSTEMFVNGIEIGNDVLMEYNKVLKKITILVDGMYCLYDKDFKINEELLNLIDNFNTWNILTVNGFREKGYKLVDKSNWAPFSLEKEGIKKEKPEYFKRLLEQYKLNPKDVIYIEHDKNNVKVAESLGIKSFYYKDNSSTKKFIEENLYYYKLAKQKNIDFGGGVERTLAILNGFDDNYLTEIWQPIIKKIEELSNKEYGKSEGITKDMRIIADHIKASVFILSEEITPSNTEQGYVLRRLIRRAIRYGTFIGLKNFTDEVARPVFQIYSDYKHLQKKKKQILEELKKEEEKFNKTIQKGLRIFDKKIIKAVEKKNKSLKGKRYIGLEKKNLEEISGKQAFLLYQSYGFPLELILEEAKKCRGGMKVDVKGFKKELSKHQELSRTASAGKFKSGLADQSEKTTQLHTATHLLLAALRNVLKDINIIQKGSNITPERLRFDFNFPRKLTKEELKKVEDLVNIQIQKSCEVKRQEMSPAQAKKKGATGIFDKKYGKKVSVYTIGDFSKEICAGPHVKNTCELGHFKIIKETSSSAGVRRIKAVLE